MSGAAANAKRAETLAIELSQEKQATAALREKVDHLNTQLAQSRSTLERAQQQSSKQRDTELANLQLMEQTGNHLQLEQASSLGRVLNPHHKSRPKQVS